MLFLQKKVCCFIFSGPKLDKVMTISTSYPFVGLLLCPVKAYCHFSSLVPGGGDDPVFAVPVKGKLEPVSKHALLKRFREMLLLIDLDPASYSFHSLRHGGATLAAKAGVPEALLKHHRDW